MNALEMMAAAQSSRVVTVSDTPLGIACAVCGEVVNLDAPATIEQLARAISEHVAGEHAS